MQFILHCIHLVGQIVRRARVCRSQNSVQKERNLFQEAESFAKKWSSLWWLACLGSCFYNFVTMCLSNISVRPHSLETGFWPPTLLNPVPWQYWMAAYLGYTLWMKTLFRGWQVMVHDAYMRRRRSNIAGILVKAVIRKVWN